MGITFEIRQIVKRISAFSFFYWAMIIIICDQRLTTKFQNIHTNILSYKFERHTVVITLASDQIYFWSC